MTCLSIRAALLLSLVAGFALTSWLLGPVGEASEIPVDLELLRLMRTPLH
jgi:hypothetical protein